MKKLIAVVGIMALTSTAQASQYLCSGEAEYGQYKIVRLLLGDKEISLDFQKAGSKVVSKKFIIVEVKQNGETDIRKQPATFIGANTSGNIEDYSDDLALPRFGLYKSGLGSEIAFESGEGRVFGTVQCRKL